MAFGGETGDKTLVGGVYWEEFFRWEENEQISAGKGGLTHTPPPPPHSPSKENFTRGMGGSINKYYSYLIYIKSLQTLHTLIYIHCMGTQYTYT